MKRIGYTMMALLMTVSMSFSAFAMESGNASASNQATNDISLTEGGQNTSAPVDVGDLLVNGASADTIVALFPGGDASLLSLGTYWTNFAEFRFDENNRLYRIVNIKSPAISFYGMTIGTPYANVDAFLKGKNRGGANKNGLYYTGEYYENGKVISIEDWGYSNEVLTSFEVSTYEPLGNPEDEMKLIGNWPVYPTPLSAPIEVGQFLINGVTIDTVKTALPNGKSWFAGKDAYSIYGTDFYFNVDTGVLEEIHYGKDTLSCCGIKLGDSAEKLKAFLDTKNAKYQNISSTGLIADYYENGKRITVDADINIVTGSLMKMEWSV